MVFPTQSVGYLTAELVNHLWQSTVFAAGAWLLTIVLRRNQARTRYRLWVVASVKFLIPFSILISAGERLQLRAVVPGVQPALSMVMNSITEPYSISAGARTGSEALRTASTIVVRPVAAGQYGDWLVLLLIGIWGCGLLLLLARWGRSWWHLHSALRAASPMMRVGDVPVLSTPMRLEPGVFGILRPVLVLPEGIRERLSAPQLDAILAHELCHVRRRDNLTAALHTVVESLFWFHPAVWWIRTRLVEERERACDEAVLESNREALAYAEGILNVCKFYVEAPLTCVSGVTGSDLKKRIVRIMAEQAARKLDLARRLMLGFAAILAVTIPVVYGLVHASEVHAQTAAQKTSIEDTWQGTLHIPQKDLRTVLKITKTDAGQLKATMYSIDQGGQGIPATTTTFDGSVLKYSVEIIDGTYEGKMSSDGKSITGSWKQGPNPIPLVYERATPETAWAIPEPPPKVPPMAADANPSFEVATIKPSKPDQPGKLFGVRGDRFKTINTTLLDLISFAYDVHAKQVIGATDWMESEKFDIDAQPDTPGSPNRQQLKTMVQKLLADRFQLKFHQDKKELSAYVLGVAKSGSKLKKSDGDPNGLPGLFFRQLGVLTVRNATMADFAQLMQSAVLDRPVVDQTGLQGKWDFLLKWTPDESQFGGMGMKVPPPSDAADAPPPLFTAIQEQIGLKLDAGKAPVQVLVLDHVEKPSEN
jgi:uncharacterized protein (TIGR03435 family)